MPNIDLSILNQRQTPAFYADVFANRPAAGFVGRIFVSTDTYAFYRDNGTSWDLIGGPGTGTVTGTGANGQVTFWNGASTITGSNDLFWDATNGHLGVNTNAPGTALDVHHDQPTVAIVNQTVATNDTRIGFQNNGVGLWRIGAFYNAGANDFGIFDAVGNIQPVTVKKNTGQVLIGTSTVGAGKLVVASASSDNGIQIVGASAPSLRIDSAESGPTKRAGLGISTATNNFIQGSADRDFCIFNGSTAAASPILFGIYDAAAVNVQEAARISAARNFIVGKTTDSGEKLQVAGNIGIPDGSKLQSYGGTQSYYYPNSGASELSYQTTLNIRAFNSNNPLSAMYFSSAGNVGIGTSAPQRPLQVNGTEGVLRLTSTASGNDGFEVGIGTSSQAFLWQSENAEMQFATNNTLRLTIASTGELLFKGATTIALGTLVFSNNDSFFALYGTEGGGTTKDIVLQTGGSGSAPSVTLKAGGNFLIGTTTDAGQKLQVAGMLNSGISYRAGTYTQGTTTPSVTGVSYLNISNSSPTTITNFTGGIENQVITLYFNDSNTTITRNNAYLSGGVNFVSTAYDMLTLMYINGFWYEISRSVNS